MKFDQSARVYVIPPKKSYGKGHLAGLCGDYNGKDDDDFKKPDLSMADNALKFAKAWGDQSGACSEPTNADSCAANSFRKPWAQKGLFAFLSFAYPFNARGICCLAAKHSSAVLDRGQGCQYVPTQAYSFLCWLLP